MTLDLSALIKGERDYGDLTALSRYQKTALTGIVSLVLDKTLPRTSSTEDEDNALPSLVFVDGARGSGKTHILNCAEKYIELLGENVTRPDDTRLRELVAASSEPRPPGFDVAKDRSFFKQRFADLKEDGGEFKKPALLVDCIYPSDMQGDESPMTHLIARLVKRIDQDLAALTDSQAERRTMLEDLKRGCRAISNSWVFARNVGVESILYNTSSIKKFFAAYGEEAETAASRKQNWDQLVSTLLDQLGYNVLVVPIDDMDSARALNVGVLEVLSSYLHHNRIVTLVAGNMRTLQNQLLIAAFSAIGAAAASRASKTTLRELRDAARLEVEQRLQKIFPIARRFYLAPEPRHSGPLPGPKDVLRSQIACYQTADFDLICQKMLDWYRPAFIRAKVNAYEKFRGQAIEVDRADRLRLENFIAWWLFRRSYLERLRPRSPRHILSFLTLTRPDRDRNHEADAGDFRLGPFKRLAVILFNQAPNAILAHQFADDDANVLQWLKRQTLGSEWKRGKSFTINGRPYFEGSYAYDYIRFRIDVGLALPLRVNEQEDVPRELLPRFLGFERWLPLCEESMYDAKGRHINTPVFGLARSLEHCVAPANCCHMYDLSSLPEATFAGGADIEAPSNAILWEGRLVKDWPRFFAGNPRSERDRVLAWLVGVAFPALRDLTKDQAIEISDTTDPQPISKVFECMRSNLATCDKESQRIAATLIADVRRAWLAMSVFTGALARAAGPEDEHDLPAGAQSEEPRGPGLGPALRPTFGLRMRAPDLDKFAVPTLERLQKIFKFHKELEVWFERSPEADALYGDDKVFQGLFDALIDPHFPAHEASDGPKRIYESMLDKVDAAQASRMRFEVLEREDRFVARLFRPTLLFVHAIAPTFPSLAALAGAVALRSGDGDAGAVESVQAWRRLLRQCAVFLAFARREILQARDKMKRAAKLRRDEKESKIHSMFIPDFSWFSLFGDPEEFDAQFGLASQEGLLVGTAISLHRSNAAMEELLRVLEEKPRDDNR